MVPLVARAEVAAVLVVAAEWEVRILIEVKAGEERSSIPAGEMQAQAWVAPNCCPLNILKNCKKPGGDNGPAMARRFLN